MEKYLRKCLDSLIVSDENMQRLEVLVINDGSKDSSSQIAHEYEGKYPQTFRVIDKENRNYGSCINRGLKEATGKYVKVLDADDYFETEEFEKFVETAKLVDADLILSNYNIVDEKENLIEEKRYNLPVGKILQRKNVDHEKSFYKLSMHGIAYNREIFCKFDYFQSEGISYTDQEWIFTPMYFVNTVYFTECSVYRYLIGREGQTMDPKVTIRCMSHTVQGLFKMISDYSKMHFEEDDNKTYFRHKLRMRLRSVYLSYIIKNYRTLASKEFYEIDDKIRKMNEEVYHWTESLCLYNDFVPFVKIWRKNPDGLCVKLLRIIVYFVERGAVTLV